MRYCTNCGKELLEDAKFCAYCGTAANGESKSKRKMVYEGDVHKCPNCGEIVGAFTTNCPTCGFEFRNVQATNAGKELAEKIEKIENSRSSRQSGWKKLFDTKGRVSETDQEKISLIRGFAIPNSKEDLFEFMVLASSNINIRRYSEPNVISASECAVSDAWYSKFEQSYEKAKISIKDLEEFEKIKNIFTKKQKEISSARRKRWLTVIAPIVGIAAILCSVLMLSDYSLRALDVEEENDRLNALASEIYEAIDSKNYNTAKAKTANLVYAGPGTADGKKSAEKWEKTRNELLDIIANAEKAERAGDDNLSQATEPATTYGETIDDSNELSRVPDDFYNGYTEANFSDYNSPAKENGLGGSRIYFTGTLDKTEVYAADEYNCILGYLTDLDGNTWLLMLNVIPLVEESHYDAAVGKKISCTGVYDGYSDLLEMPMTIVNEIFVLQDGTRLNGLQKILDQG